MKRDRTRQIASALILLLLGIVLIGCTSPYRAEQFLGRTSAEITAEFGSFDCVTAPADADGLYRSCSCGYTIREPRVGFLGTSPEVLFFISFDADGIAYECTEGYRPGG